MANTREEVFDLIVAKMQAAKQDHIRLLNEQIFAVGASTPVPPLTWQQRWLRRWRRAENYLVTLWDALRGRDPYDVEHDW